MESKRTVSRRSLLKGAVVAGGAMLVGPIEIGSARAAGASTSVPSYVLPSTSGIDIIPILTTGERADNGYRMVGIPDGLGAFSNGRTFTLLMNHELTASSGSSGPGLVRAHGRSGAFVSKWTIDRQTFRVISGEDL